jgi:hypothetical protein
MPQHPELPHSIFRAESTPDSASLLLDTLSSQCTPCEGQNSRMNILEEFLEGTWAPSLGELAQVLGQVLCRRTLIIGGEAGGVRP